jgi:hypothetical protein
MGSGLHVTAEVRVEVGFGASAGLPSREAPESDSALDEDLTRRA